MVQWKPWAEKKRRFVTYGQWAQASRPHQDWPRLVGGTSSEADFARSEHRSTIGGYYPLFVGAPCVTQARGWAELPSDVRIFVTNHRGGREAEEEAESADQRPLRLPPPCSGPKREQRGGRQRVSRDGGGGGGRHGRGGPGGRQAGAAAAEKPAGGAAEFPEAPPERARRSPKAGWRRRPCMPAPSARSATPSRSCRKASSSARNVGLHILL